MCVWVHWWNMNDRSSTCCINFFSLAISVIVPLFKTCDSTVFPLDLDGYSKWFLIIISNFPRRKFTSKLHIYVYNLCSGYVCDLEFGVMIWCYFRYATNLLGCHSYTQQLSFSTILLQMQTIVLEKLYQRFYTLCLVSSTKRDWQGTIYHG